MLFQKFLKRIKKRLEGIDFFYLAISPGLEPTFIYDFLKEEDYNFKPILVLFDERSRIMESKLKDAVKINSEFFSDDVFRVFPKRKYFVYYSIIRGYLERKAAEEEIFVLLPESSEEVFAHILYHFLLGNIQKIYKHGRISKEFHILNPLIDIGKKWILKYVQEKGLEFFNNPYKEEQYYRSLIKTYELISTNYEDFSSVLQNIINRNLRTINLKIIKCEKCGNPSLSKICDLCKILNEVKREISKEEREKDKKPKKKLRPIRRVFRGVRR